MGHSSQIICCQSVVCKNKAISTIVLLLQKSEIESAVDEFIATVQFDE